jgi:hypothetical protein
MINPNPKWVKERIWCGKGGILTVFLTRDTPPSCGKDNRREKPDSIWKEIPKTLTLTKSPNQRKVVEEGRGLHWSSLTVAASPARGKKREPPLIAVCSSFGQGHRRKASRRRRAQPRASARAGEKLRGGTATLLLRQPRVVAITVAFIWWRVEEKGKEKKRRERKRPGERLRLRRGHHLAAAGD